MKHIPVNLLAAAAAFLFCAANAYGQYRALVEKADSLYSAKAFKHSAAVYSEAFAARDAKISSRERYNAACSWALAGEADSAFYCLEKLASHENYSNLGHISTDKDLDELHTDKRWQPLLDRISQNKEKLEASWDRPLIRQLDSMAAEDQKWRAIFRKARKGQPSADNISWDMARTTLLLTDSLNYFRLVKIFDRYGFPNYDVVGQQASQKFWLLVQHQDEHPAFQEKVLQQMKKEVDAKKASASDYAYLVDRVQWHKGMPQVYGTQTRFNADSTALEPMPVIEPEKLNERREQVGLESIEKYMEKVNRMYAGTLKKK
jgi:hypothetical protein